MNTYPEVNEADWKLFRSRLPDWQEAHLNSLIRGYIELLNGPGTASDRIWALEQRIRRDKHDAGTVIDMRRSRMQENLMRLLFEGSICLEDLDGFSDALRERMADLLEWYRSREKEG